LYLEIPRGRTILFEARHVRQVKIVIVATVRVTLTPADAFCHAVRLILTCVLKLI
jgi:hypothetical protein